MRTYTQKNPTDRDILTEKAMKNYDVDFNKGLIFSKKSNKWLKPILRKDGYTIVGLKNGSKWFTTYYHRAIFIKANGVSSVIDKQISHKDKIKTNNCLNNLQALHPIDHNNYDGIDITKYSNNRLKTEWPPCFKCGTNEGWIHPAGKTPARYSGLKFGIPGKICKKCYDLIRR